ncbi:MAG: peptidylprolyl isomerase [Alphaproteobacteria bacterium]|nr:peptidylprolyl isomerase [Alphaproteobacteria bacterium]
MRPPLAAFALGAILALAAHPAWAQTVQRIAAIVNDEVISGYDLDQRVGLVVATSGVNVNDDILKRIRDQVLRSLVDERLQLQEARRLNVAIEPKEIDQALQSIAHSNNTSVEAIEGQLANLGISMSTLRRQIEAEIAWNTLVNERFAPRISVSDDEVNLVLERVQQSTDEPQYLLAEIFLGVDSPDQDAAIHATADRLVQQIRQGAPFQAVAQQFSQSASASTGGDIGWVEDSQLDPDLASAVRPLSPGNLAGPVRTVSGYYVLFLRDRRIVGNSDPLDVELQLRQAVLPLLPNAPAQTVADAENAARDISARIPGCPGIDQLAQMPQVLTGEIGTRKLRALAPEFREAVASLQPGQASAPIRSKVGFHVLVVCNRFNESVNLPTADEIRQRLYNQQLSMMQRRYLRDLRRDATVEMR